MMLQEDLFKQLLESAPDAIIIINHSGKIVLTNAQAERVFDYSKVEMLNQKMEMLLPERFQSTHHSHRTGYFQDPKVRPMGQGLELWGRRKDGTEFPLEISLSPLKLPDGNLAMAAVRDVTLARQQSDRLKESLEEKEVLLKEVHHRVKNNLQIVSSLLNLQGTGAVDPSSVALLEESRRRIRSMALVHEKLYQSADLTRLNFGVYIRDLTSELQVSFSASEKVRIDLECDEIQVGLDQAIPMGLLANELISNSIKHGFEPGGEGSIRILIKSTGDKTTLEVADNGKGLPENFDPNQLKTLGMQLVIMLTKQLRGTISWKNHNGAAFKVELPRMGMAQ